MHPQIPFLLALHRGMGLTYIRFENLKEYFHDDFKAAFEASFKDLESAGIDKKGLEKWSKNKANASPEKEIKLIKDYDIKVLIKGSSDYPLNFEGLYNPPPLLFMKGTLEPQDFPSIGVVGSRKMTPYGKRGIDFLISPLLESGVCLTSGLAYGVDFYSHKKALECGSRTLAVLGSGLDEIYPSAHQSWADKKVQEGSLVLISEFLPKSPIIPENFPMRNRLIGALSKALVVVEAGKKSGSLITARMANEQGKEVFALPGDIFSPQSEGCHELLVQGEAQPLISPDQLLTLFCRKSEKKSCQKIPSSGLERDVLQYFENAIILQIDEITRKSKIPTYQLISTLLLLEMQGFLIQERPGEYRRKI